MAKSKEIIVVYQDCVLCGDRGRKKRQNLLKKGLNIRKVSVFSREGAELSKIAVFEKGLGALPFYTDGEKFSYKAEDFIKKPVTEQKPKKVKEKKEDESVSEN